MKRAGFTMIELIFVIVILGILASVAVPKLIGVKDSAEEGLAKGFTGTLNRTVGASKWSSSLMDGADGQLRGSTTYDITTADTEFPNGITPPLLSANCAPDDNGSAAVTALNSGPNDSFFIFCKDGSSSASPKFYYSLNSNGHTQSDFTNADSNRTMKLP